MLGGDLDEGAGGFVEQEETRGVARLPFAMVGPRS
jgi:hypothetical protein